MVECMKSIGLMVTALLLCSLHLNAGEVVVSDVVDESSIACNEKVASPLDIIPLPSNVVLGEDVCRLDDGLRFWITNASKSACSEQMQGLRTYVLGLPMDVALAENRKSANLLISICPPTGKNKNLTVEGSYKMSVGKDRIEIISATPQGAFYGLQSLLLMTRMGRVACVRSSEIYDSPRYSYRGLHFDVSRHFRAKEFLLKQMDAMALFKLNKMHLHLTDGAGWRLQIDAYPRLTEYAAWRPQKKWYDWWMADRAYCEGSSANAYGGYYTKEDIREILQYAKERHIDVIPEIEMPGHSEEVLAAYPELLCVGASGSSDFCPGKELTYKFLETVLSEVIELFPSEYIHIGGDEAGKAHWHNCTDCQARMKAEGLESVEQLQSYLIHRIEKFVNSKGRKIIGWDEILEGGLAPNATVMSWRGEEGGIKAAQSGHDVIMTPAGYCYLDYTQDAPFKEPVSIGGYLPLSKTYSYEPASPQLTVDQQSNILGVQGNLWSEYVTEDSHAEYMYYPRALAISEIGWTPSELKDFDSFRKRALRSLDLLSDLGYNTFNLKNEYGERRESLEMIEHLGVGASVEYQTPYHAKYPSSGHSALVDGVLGGWTYGDLRWQGFLGDADLTVDLHEVMDIHYVGATFMNLASAWVHVPERVEIQVSVDGQTYESLGLIHGDVSIEEQELLFKTYFKVCDCKARFIKLLAKGCQRDGAWLFVDEVVIN